MADNTEGGDTQPTNFAQPKPTLVLALIAVVTQFCNYGAKNCSHEYVDYNSGNPQYLEGDP